MKSFTGKEICRLVERHGWKLLRIHGSHHIYGKEGSVVRLSVPVHGNHPLKTGLAKSLLKSAGLAEEDI
ncbi:MAG: type II toxin-antitoxin system HicA family toxin [Candidatus Hydrogenedentes bacterium]|nr:type II toxin-antitoxin system HicA family toxin [Candidatus Hydrogenedentota bacterium]